MWASRRRQRYGRNGWQTTRPQEATASSAPHSQPVGKQGAEGAPGPEALPGPGCAKQLRRNDDDDDDDAATIDRSMLRFLGFSRNENFGNERMGRRDQFRPKIIEIGAIVAIFRLFEDLRQVISFTLSDWR